MIDPRTDCHCHILPLMDDGSGSMEESLHLARKQVGWGYRKAVCTAHRTEKYPNTPDSVRRACDQLQEELSRQAIPLELTPSMEYRLLPGTWPETLEKGWLMPWEGNHILMEMNIHTAAKLGNLVPEDEIKRIADMGFQPVLAHPERYLYLEMDRYPSLKAAGALFQRNVGSMEGLYGPEVRARARAIMDMGLYDLVATDLHRRQYADFFDAIGFKVKA